MTEHIIHESLPSGFHYADRLQAAEYERTGFINGAAKVVFVARPANDPFGIEYDVACRLRPPRTWQDVISPLARREHGTASRAARDWYVREYNAGWQASRRGTEDGPFQQGTSSHAYDDGYLDAAAGRMKWHLTYCTEHDNCGEG